VSGLLARLYPGNTAALGVAVVFLQITVAIMVAAVVARFIAKRAAAERHAVWRAALGCILLSPILVAVVARMNFVLFTIPLPWSQPAASVDAIGPRIGSLNVAFEGRTPVSPATSQRETGANEQSRSSSDFPLRSEKGQDADVSIYPKSSGSQGHCFGAGRPLAGHRWCVVSVVGD
jgi:hypothetical protein